MTERIVSGAVFEYLVNSLWQVPLLLLATWLVVRIARPALALQHGLWIAALALGILLPLRGVHWSGDEENAPDAEPRIALEYPVTQPGPALDRPAAPPRRPAAPSLATELRELASLHIHAVHLESRTIQWMIELYAISAAFSLARLLHGWIAARRLVASAHEQPLTALESSLLRACAARLRLPLERIPAVRFLRDPQASPMIVGMRHPVLLLPSGLCHADGNRFDDTALTAMLLHELAHVRRRDYLANLVARVVSLPIAYHPATGVLHSRIRQTREMICDAHAAESFPSRSSYARSLLALAEGIVSPHSRVAAVGLFDHTRNSLEERIMQLTEPRVPNTVTLRMGRVTAGTLMLLAGTGFAATVHVKAATPSIGAVSSLTAQAPQSAPAPAAALREQAAPLQAPAPAPTPAPVPAPHAAPSRHPLPQPLAEDPQAGKLTPEQREAVDAQAAAMGQQMKALTLQLKDMPRISVPTFDLKLKLPDLDRQLADMNLQFDTPEFRKSMEDLKQQINSAEFKQQIADAANKASQGINSAELKLKMDDLNRQLNSPEFWRQIEDAKRQALQAQGRAADARRQLADASAAIAEAQKQLRDADVQKKLAEAQQRLRDATKSLP